MNIRVHECRGYRLIEVLEEHLRDGHQQRGEVEFVVPRYPQPAPCEQVCLAHKKPFSSCDHQRALGVFLR